MLFGTPEGYWLGADLVKKGINHPTISKERPSSLARVEGSRLGQFKTAVVFGLFF